jgi:hypothetical protein
MRVDSTDQEVVRIEASVARLEGQRDALKQRAEELTREIELAKGRLAVKDEVEVFIEAVHGSASRRNLAAFETLLTALVQEVLPGESPLHSTSRRSGGSPPSTSASPVPTDRSRTCWRTMAARSPT